LGFQKSITRHKETIYKSKKLHPLGRKAEDYQDLSENLVNGKTIFGNKSGNSRIKKKN